MRARAAGVVAAIAAAASAAPFAIPLPRQPDCPPEDAAARAGREGRFVSDGDGRTWIEQRGRAGDPLVVLVHGFGGSTFSWRHALEPLAEAGFRVVALDLAGFGFSERRWDRDHSVPAQANRVAAVMDAIGGPSAVLVGHSMGAGVVLELASRQPGRVLGLALVDAALAQPNTGPAGALLRLPPIRRLARIALRATLPGRADAAIRSAWHEPARATDADLAGYRAPLNVRDWDLGLLAFARDAGRSSLRFDRRTFAGLDAIVAMPVLVAWGGADPWFPVATGRAIHAALPGSTWAEIQAAGHLPMEEQPGPFVRALLDWLRRARG